VWASPLIELKVACTYLALQLGSATDQINWRHWVKVADELGIINGLFFAYWVTFYFDQKCPIFGLAFYQS
jgi:hypothetical protein